MEGIFKLYGWNVNAYKQLHQGLINTTYTVNTTSGEYILQTINHTIFKEPSLIDANINLIGQYLKIKEPDYLFTQLVPAKNGSTLVHFEGMFFRAFHKINAYALSVLDTPDQAKEAATQFGKFTQILNDLDMGSLKNTLPDFHNLSLRYHQFSKAIINGNAKRIVLSKEAISYLQANHFIVDKYEKFIQHPDVKLRVTHHDTKISNVLFKNEDGLEKAICVIDLDTVMPGYFISDVGDMCRTYLCKVSEEEKDLNLIQIEMERWGKLKNGYLSQMQNALSNFELDHFVFGGQFMIYMQALRFLTDYLNNDIYYGTKYDSQNYYRAINQIELLKTNNHYF
jgi:Ser/Thr protein kinase RdoA (MazF antagonist)